VARIACKPVPTALRYGHVLRSILDRFGFPTLAPLITSETFDSAGNEEAERLEFGRRPQPRPAHGRHRIRKITRPYPAGKDDKGTKEMNEETQLKLTGISGVLSGVMAIVVVPLYFMYGGPPPAWNVLTRTLLGVVMMAVLLVFFTGLRQLIQKASHGNDGIASIAYGAGLTYVAVTLVSISMEAGVPLYTPDGALDPTIDGPLAAGTVLIHGPIARILTIVLLVSVGYAVSRTKVLSGWVSKSAYIIAAANLAFIPSLYFGMNPANFYAANGWGSTASISSVLLYWSAAVGVAVLGQRKALAPAVEGRAFAGTV
jgi:hypothetical protein